MDYTLFFDTNALLNLQEQAFKEKFVIAQKTLEEIESIKSSFNKDGEVKYKARKVAHLLNDRESDYEVIPYSPEIQNIIQLHYLEETPDNIILASAYCYDNAVNKVIVVSDDLNCKFISKNIFDLTTKGIDDINIAKKIENYKGYKDVTLSDEEMSYFYTHLSENIFECIYGEYLIIRKSDGEIVDYRKWNGQNYAALSYTRVNSNFLRKIKPINPEQILGFDMLQDDSKTIKILAGKAGSGKDAIMIANAIKMIEDGKYDKLIYVRNPISVRDVSEIGFLPGSEEEKLSVFSRALADHLGGIEGLEMLMSSGKVEIEHLGFIRGRDLKNAIVYCSEAENLTKDHVQLLISRIGEGSSLWMNGDYKQVDSPTFRMNNGLLSAIQKLAGNESFGYVQLQKTERSKTAALADLLD